METVILTILLIFAVALIAIVLLQRSEGGGMGLGGGGGGGGVMSARGAASAMSKLTWILGAGFFAAAMALTVISAEKARDSSVIGNGDIPQSTAPAIPGNLTLPAGTDFSATPDATDMMPPATDEPITPPPAE
ncbi:MAG TPA: preprotein translocase subunit SecG [Aliiroseovarius sp.]|nr:preprotein translocase subunit SecG [Aliiroseovarius sp.]